jgi:hypothetical protein
VRALTRIQRTRLLASGAPALGGALDPAAERRPVRYHEAIALYRARRWAETLRLLDELETGLPADGPIALYRRRAQALLADPPPADWDDVFVAESK